MQRLGHFRYLHAVLFRRDLHKIIMMIVMMDKIFSTTSEECTHRTFGSMAWSLSPC